MDKDLSITTLSLIGHFRSMKTRFVVIFDTDFTDYLFAFMCKKKKKKKKAKATVPSESKP